MTIVCIYLYIHNDLKNFYQFELQNWMTQLYIDIILYLWFLYKNLWQIQSKVGKTLSLKVKGSQVSNWTFGYTATIIWKRCMAFLWRERGTFYCSVMQYKSAATPIPSWGFQTKWVTVWHFIYRGMKSTTSYKSRVTTLLNTIRLFWNFSLWIMVILMPL